MLHIPKPQKWQGKTLMLQPCYLETKVYFVSIYLLLYHVFIFLSLASSAYVWEVNRIIEWLELQGFLEIFFQPSCHGQDSFP